MICRDPLPWALHFVYSMRKCEKIQSGLRQGQLKCRIQRAPATLPGLFCLLIHTRDSLRSPLAAVLPPLSGSNLDFFTDPELWKANAYNSRLRLRRHDHIYLNVHVDAVVDVLVDGCSHESRMCESRSRARSYQSSDLAHLISSR
jgi:hypothetical protein